MSQETEYQVTAFFMDVDEDPSTPFEEEYYSIVAGSETNALNEARKRAYDSKNCIGVNVSVDVEIN